MVHLISLVSFDLVDLLAIILATYYIVLVAMSEAGPLDAFIKLRLMAGMEPGTYEMDDDTGEYVWTPVDRSTSDCRNVTWIATGKYFSRVLGCHRCASPYAAVIAISLWVIMPLLVYILAAAGAVVALKEEL